MAPPVRSRACLLTLALLGCGPRLGSIGGDESETSGEEGESDGSGETGEDTECETPGTLLHAEALPGTELWSLVGVLPDDSLILHGSPAGEPLVRRISAEFETLWEVPAASWGLSGAFSAAVAFESGAYALLVGEQQVEIAAIDPETGALAWVVEVVNDEPKIWGGRLHGRGSSLIAATESINAGNTEDRDWRIFLVDLVEPGVVWEGRPMAPGNRLDTVTMTPAGDVLASGNFDDGLLPAEGFVRFAAANGAPSWFRPREDDLRIRALAWRGGELHALHDPFDSDYEVRVYAEDGSQLRALALDSNGLSATGMQVGESGDLFLGGWTIGEPEVTGDLLGLGPEGGLRWRLSETTGEAITCPAPQIDSRGHVWCAAKRWSPPEALVLIEVCP